PLEQLKPGKGLYEAIVRQEGRGDLLDSVPTRSFPTQRYYRASGMINPHSWGPYFVNNSLTQAQFGIYSQDVLSTTSINAGYQYEINEKTGAFQAGLSYQALYPIVDIQGQIGDREETNKLSGRSVKFNWKETTGTAGLRIPLTLTNSKYNTLFQISNYVGITK